MTTLTDIIDKLNSSKLGLHLKFDCNEPENIIYFQKASEANFDHLLDEEINHLALYSNHKYGDFRGWVCKDADRKITLLTCALTRYWQKKVKHINRTVISVL